MVTNRKQNDRTVPTVVRNNKSLTLLLVFLAISVVTAVIVDVLGYPTVSGLVVAWALVIVVATVVFVIVPIYALGFIE